jgi:hypothetical protein
MTQIAAKPRKWASAFNNEALIAVETCSGYGRRVRDPSGPQYSLTSSATDEELGVAVLDCLSSSRFLDTPELRAASMHPDALAQSYAAWLDRLMQFGGFKTKRALLKDMRCCWIELEGGNISMRPSHHDKLEGWSGEGFTDLDTVVVSAAEPASAVGAALREAFRRCT